MITISNDSYTAGRIKTPRVIVLHTAEAPCEPGKAEAVARFLARSDIRASAHWVVDPANTVAQVAEADTAWAAPGANADGIQIEQCGYAAFTRDDWASGPAIAMLHGQTAPLLRGIAARWGIPLVALTSADLLAGRSGICDHATVNEAYGRSDHTDCGTSYPLAQVIAWARETTTPPEAEDMTDDQAKQLTRILQLIEAGLYPRGAVPAADAAAVLGAIKTGYTSEAMLWAGRLELERMGLATRGGPAARADVAAAPPAAGRDFATITTVELANELARRLGT